MMTTATQWSAGDVILWDATADHEAEPARVRVELRPALRMESFFRQWFGLARDGKVDRRGMPNLLQLAATMREFEREIRPPHIAQRAVLPPLARIARLLGYRGRYARYERPGGLGDSR